MRGSCTAHVSRPMVIRTLVNKYPEGKCKELDNTIAGSSQCIYPSENSQGPRNFLPRGGCTRNSATFNGPLRWLNSCYRTPIRLTFPLKKEREGEWERKRAILPLLKLKIQGRRAEVDCSDAFLSDNFPGAPNSSV